MSRLGDYQNSMKLSQFADEEIEQLISRQIANDPELAALAALLTDLRGENLAEPSPAEVERLARNAASVVRSLPEPLRSAPAPRRPRNLLTVFRTYSATAAVSSFALVAFFGLGLAANASVPGDLLYGFDLAMERVGIGAGALEERISEGQVLADRGQHIEAADHLKASISNFGEQATAEDLLRAGNALAEYEDKVDGNATPDVTLPPANENTGPDNNNASGNSGTNPNPNPGPDNNPGTENGANPNPGPDNNNAGGNSGTIPNPGPDNNNAGGNSGTNPNPGPDNNNAGGNSGTNPKAGPGNNNAGGNGKGGN